MNIGDISLVLEQEIYIRVGFFVGGLILFTGMGFVFSYRKFEKQIDLSRWGHNLALTVLNTVILRILLPTTLVAFAIGLQQKEIGLLHWLSAPIWLNIVVSVVALDLIIYWQHVVLHKVPTLWRLHRVHHSDIGFDATTALRFHPFEILLSMIVKASFILALGIRAEAVVLFEVILNFSAMFNHANFSLPPSVERLLRATVVTPDMHRIHHSVIYEEANSNFGFCLSLWDRLFGSYKDHSKNDLSKADVIGLNEFRSPTDHRLDRLIVQPGQPLEK